MRRSVGFTFTGEVVTHGLKVSAPFRVSEVSAGTEAAQKLLVGDEIVQVDELKVDGSLDMSALRKVIITSAAPSLTVEVRRGTQSHRLSILKRVGSDKKSSQKLSGHSDQHKESASTPSSRSRDSVNFDETEASTSSKPVRETTKSVRSMRRHVSSELPLLSSMQMSGPSISPPPQLPRSDEFSNDEVGMRMPAAVKVMEKVDNSEGHGKGRHQSLSARFLRTVEGSASECAARSLNSRSMSSIGMDDRTWQSDSPCNKTPACHLSPSPLSGTQEAGRSVNNIGESIVDEMEMSLIKTVDDLAAQREFADSLILQVSALKKKISATARSISVRNGSTLDEWDNHMRIMRNELFSMCGLLSEAEGNLKQAMARADEHVNHVSKTLLWTLDDKETRSSRSGARKQVQDHIELRLEMMVVRQRLDRAMQTCQNCIVTLEDDIGSISEQARLSDLHNDFLNSEQNPPVPHGSLMNQSSACVNTFLCSGFRP